MKSMTGFGRATAELPQGQLTVEVRTVNHRSLDIKLRSRDLDGGTENALLAAVRAALKRGSVALHVEVAPKQMAGFDHAWYLDVARAVNALGESLGVACKPDLATVAAFAAQMRDSQPGGSRARLIWEQLAPVVQTALCALEESRSREGQSLQADLSQRLAHLSQIADALAAKTSGASERAASRLATRVAALAGDVGVDPQRLAQEVAMMADRADVTEELVRLRTHLQHFGSLVNGGSQDAADGVGRRMDFWLQEIGREFNTLASKSQDADVSALVVDAKAELEKLREQAQNIE
ncbi:MAG: DUF1732 domain-containing protein [Deltaproteobacteria bacterium]|nr:DUF1732 domain-containing protein [Deltaproteobacteria bacterium]